MKAITQSNGLFPRIFDDLFIENRLDHKDYDIFSTPALNIKEYFSTFVLEFAAPGMKKENFTVELEKNVLKVTASINSTKEDEAENDEKYTRREFNYGNFSRSFRLSHTIDRDDIGATYEDGILSITLPKKEAEKDIKRMVEIS